jgi:hypothetical protein
MQKIEELLQSPYTALSVAIVLGALALSGRFSVTITQFLLVCAWGVAFVGMRGFPLPILVGSSTMLAGGLILLGYWFRPEAVPGYTGVLTPQVTVLFSARSAEASTIPRLQFGTSNEIVTQKEIGRDGAAGTLLLPALSEGQFKIESIGGKIKVSTQIADDTGNLVVVLDRNEWKVAPPPRTWDRNYSDDALEVKDAAGRVVLQVKALPDRIQLQGMWWVDIGPPNGHIRFILRGNPRIGAQINLVPKVPRDPNIPTIDPMFVYPGDQHLGELIK